MVPRKGHKVASAEADTQKLGVPFKSNGVKKNAFHIEVEQGKIIKFLTAVFDPKFYEKYSFHLEKDDDDALPEPVESTGHVRQFMASKQKDVKKLTQVRKPLRKPLQVTSDSFDPSKLDMSDITLKTEVQTAAPIDKPPVNEEKQPETKPDQPVEQKQSQAKPKATGGRKPIGNY